MRLAILDDLYVYVCELLCILLIPCRNLAENKCAKHFCPFFQQEQ